MSKEKTMTALWSGSSRPNGIPWSRLGCGSGTEFTVTVRSKMKSSAANGAVSKSSSSGVLPMFSTWTVKDRVSSWPTRKALELSVSLGMAAITVTSTVLVWVVSWMVSPPLRREVYSMVAWLLNVPSAGASRICAWSVRVSVSPVQYPGA